MREREIIEAIARGLPRARSQENGLFTSDAEIIQVDGCRLAITVDDYSAEDRLAARDGKLLGWNLVTATVSDLLAVGAEPRFMLNSLVTSPDLDAAYLHALSAGMDAALAACGASMAGGDIGAGADWRFTGVALGTFRAGQLPLSRVLPVGARAGAVAAAGAIMATGTFGDANLAAGAGGPAPRFELRLTESAALAEWAVRAESAARAAPGTLPTGIPRAACVDTSDGLASGLETFATLNPNLHLEIDLAAIPYAPGISDTAAAMQVPPEVFLLGSAGEYELLALVVDDVVGGIAPLERAGLRRIGSFTTDAASGTYLRAADRCVALPELPDPRAAASFDAYRADLVALAQRLFGASGRR